MPLTTFAELHHMAFTANDADTDYDVNPAGLRVDFSILTNPAYVSFSPDGRYFSGPRQISAGVFASIDFIVRKIRVRNVTPGSPAFCDFTFYYSPVEITGDTYVRPL